MQRIGNLVDLEKRCKMSIWLQNFALIQPRTSPLKFDHLAEKSEKDSVSNLAPKVESEAPEHWTPTVGAVFTPAPIVQTMAI